MEAIWSWVNARLVQRGWTQTDLASAARVSPNVVTRLKQGGEPSIESLVKIAGAFGVSLTEMLSDCGFGQVGERPGHAQVLDAIRQDPDLLPEAKDHLTRQYGLLLRVRHSPDSESGPAVTLRAVAQTAPPGATPGEDPIDGA